MESFEVTREKLHPGNDREGDTFAVCFISQGERKKVKGRWQQSVSRAPITGAFQTRVAAQHLAERLNRALNPTKPAAWSEIIQLFRNIKHIAAVNGPIHRDVDHICELLNIGLQPAEEHKRFPNQTNSEPLSWTADQVHHELIELSSHKAKVADMLRQLARQISPKE